MKRLNLRSLYKFVFIGSLILFALSPGISQNLVPNPSFEIFVDLPCNYFESGDVFNKVVENWVSPTNSSPDIFSYEAVLADGRVCNNHPDGSAFLAIASQVPKDGKSMLGLINLYNVFVARSYREYAQVKLKEALVPGNNYHYGFYVNLADVSRQSANKLGLYFSSTPPKSDTSLLLNVKPQIVLEKPIVDKNNWVFINGSYSPTNLEYFLTIGNFSEYDDIKIVDVDSTFSNLGQAFSDVVYYLIDSVFVEPINKLTIPNVITPNNDEYNQYFQISDLQENRWILSIYNRWGQLVFESRYYHNEWQGKGLSSGVYYYLLKHRYIDIEYKGEIFIVK